MGTRRPAFPWFCKTNIEQKLPIRGGPQTVTRPPTAFKAGQGILERAAAVQALARPSHWTGPLQTCPHSARLPHAAQATRSPGGAHPQVDSSRPPVCGHPPLALSGF